MSDTSLRAFPSEWDAALVVVAQPDDIEWSAAAAVCAWTDAGKRVDYLLVTRGEAGIAGMAPEVSGPAREDEQRQAAAIVGAGEVDFLDYADGRIEEGLGLRRDIARVVRRRRPGLVVTLNHRERWGPDAGGAPWNSADHRAVGRATLDAVADAANEWIFPELTEEGLAPWDGARLVAIGGSPVPTHSVDVTGCVDRAIASLAAHAKYLEALRPDGGVEEMIGQVVTRAVGGDLAHPHCTFELLGGA
jgi:LmbE family N-acetylglucosaminyl deacetylase